MDDEQLEGRKRRRWPRRLAIASLLVLLLALLLLLALWLLRFRLVEDYLERELARREVEAQFELKRVGLRTQRLENLVIGDPDDPDLVARSVEVDLDIGLAGVDVDLVTARGARLFGRLVDGRVTFGAVDRLLPPPSGLPFRLPSQRVDIADSAVAIETPAGRLALGVNGRGNLADGFRGRMALLSRELRLGECRIQSPAARVRVAVNALRPTVVGPLRMESLSCKDGPTVAAPRFALRATLAPAFDAWRGSARVAADRFRASPGRTGSLSGHFSFAGDAERTAGEIDLAAADVRAAPVAAGQGALAGQYALSLDSGSFSFDGDVTARALRIDRAVLASVSGSLRSAGGTPLGPVGDRLADAVERVARLGADGSARLAILNDVAGGGFRLDRLRLASRSGARLAAESGRGLRYDWPAGQLRLDGAFALSGGGFPDARFTVRQPRPDGRIEGFGRIAPVVAGDARLALGDIRFAIAPGGATRIQMSATIDGPFDGGRVEGLRVPVSGRIGGVGGGFAFGTGCAEASFRLLVAEGLLIGPTRLPLCPTGPALLWRSADGRLRGGAEISRPRFAGRLGVTPVSFAADRLRLSLSDRGFSTAGLLVRLGAEEPFHQLDAQSVSGRVVRGGVAGRFQGLSARLANVPLLVGEGSGAWRVEDGDVLLGGRIQVADAADPPRFHPLVSDDLRLTVRDQQVEATGLLRHPESGTAVTRARVTHDLRSGTGRAVLDVPGLRFTEGFQPDDLTPLTVGVVALVEGTVTGRGEINWRPGETRSTGTFATADMDLAAPFGPVEGLSTTIRFTDLLGLVSAPGQEARVDLVRTGIDVLDGLVRYQLLPDSHVRVEGGRWPFAGGTLLLEPTLLDFGKPSTKLLTFQVIGLEAARLVEQMEFGNIAATGTFDGVIPMQFDISGGRIVGGRLEARPPGGTLSYVGELTDRDLGVYGKLAFDALKSLRYDRFVILLDGALAGEFLTRIELDGVARDPTLIVPPAGGIAGAIVGRALGQLAKIPFEFNISIRGPFRALIATARSFDDPTPLIEQVLPQLLRGEEIEVTDVQDEESEPVQ